MASAMPYMPFYPSDYLSDTQHLTTVEHGAYLLLIFNYWQRGSALPDDNRRLAGIAKLPLDQWLDVRVALEDFFVILDGYWQHIRIEKEFAKVKNASKKASLAGKASAAKRQKLKENLTVVQRKANGRSTFVNHTNTNTNTDTDINHQEEPLTF